MSPRQHKRKYPQHGKGRNKPSYVYLIIVGGGIILLLAIAGWFVQNASVKIEGIPSIAVDPSQINFGDVKLGTPLSFTIKVTNRGNGILKFEEKPYIEVLEGC